MTRELAGAPDDILQLARDWPLAERFALGPDAVIVVVGAYKGKAMELLARMYPDYQMIAGFEPQGWAREEARDRLASLPHVEVHPVGLGTADVIGAQMGEWHTDACSFVNTGPGTREQGYGDLREADAALSAAGLSHIDLMVMNIEGFEYQLLPHLRAAGWLARIERLALQWHLDLRGPWPKGLEPDMGAEIERLAGDGFRLDLDERPTWTYHVRQAS